MNYYIFVTFWKNTELLQTLCRPAKSEQFGEEEATTYNSKYYNLEEKYTSYAEVLPFDYKVEAWRTEDTGEVIYSYRQ